MANKASAQNGKLGGRPAGRKNDKTLEKEAVIKAFNERIFRIVDSLIDPQISLAKGQQFLYRIDKEKIVGPKGGISYRSKRPQLVTDESEIRAYLEGIVENGDYQDETDRSSAYYYITAKEPNNMAIDSLFNRTLGKPKESVELTGENGEPIKMDVGIKSTIDKIYGSTGTESV